MTNHEHHRPIIEIKHNKIVVTVGDTYHPMTKEHHLEWIELEIDEKKERKNLEIGQIPIAQFDIPEDYDKITARTKCNQHGEWSTSI